MTQHSHNSEDHDELKSEVVSALLDDELGSSDLKQQLADDAEAKSIADAYRRIDEAVLKSLACPSDQETAIITGSLRRVRESKRPKPLLYALQAVAGIAAAAIIVFSWRALQSPAIDLGPVVAELAPAKPITSPPSENSVVPAPRPMVAANPAAHQPGTVRFSDITLVSAGAVARPPLTVDAPVAAADDQVADHVRHVWLVKDATNPLRWLRPRLPGHEDSLDHWIDTDSESYRLQLTLSDRELQGLVNQLSQQGYALLSPDAPQPGLFRQGSFSERPVVYEVHFVEK